MAEQNKKHDTLLWEIYLALAIWSGLLALTAFAAGQHNICHANGGHFQKWECVLPKGELK
jgi:hypothetical protein